MRIEEERKREREEFIRELFAGRNFRLGDEHYPLLLAAHAHNPRVAVGHALQRQICMMNHGEGKREREIRERNIDIRSG